jgi:FkbM family methyltransferase
MRSPRFYIDAVRREPRPARFLMSRALWWSGACRALTVRQDGYRIRFHPSSISASLWLDPTDRAATPAFMRAYLAPGDVAVDVGANVGTTALAAAVAVGPAGRVHAIEAHPRTYRFLLDNISLNGADNVTPHNVAIGDGGGVVRFSDGRWDDQNRVTDEGDIEVAVRRLDAVVDDPVVDLLKIDVEGYELMVLRGATAVLGRTRCVYLEAWETAYRAYGYGTPDVVALLRNSGFEIFSEPASGELHPIPDGYEAPTNQNLVAAREPGDLRRRLGI